MKYYITFGQNHRHQIGDKVFDKDCVGVLEADSSGDARAKTRKLFDRDYYLIYKEQEWPKQWNHYHPRGFIDIPTEPEPQPTTLLQEDRHWQAACMAMQGMLANPEYYGHKPEAVIREAFEIADAMLAEADRRKEADDDE